MPKGLLEDRSSEEDVVGTEPRGEIIWDLSRGHTGLLRSWTQDSRAKPLEQGTCTGLEDHGMRAGQEAGAVEGPIPGADAGESSLPSTVPWISIDGLLANSWTSS